MINIRKSKATYQTVPKPNYNHNHAKRNVLIKKVIHYNFLMTVTRDEHFYFNNKPLLSPSRLMKILNEYKYSNIPHNVLKIAQNRGKRLMENLQYWFENQCEINEIPFLEGEREKIFPLFKWLIDNNAQVVAVEKFIHNGTFCGFIDLIIKMDRIFYIVEIKTRSNNELWITDRFQTYIYSKLLGNAQRLLLIIDASNIVHEYYLSNRIDKRYFTNMQQFLEEFQVSLPNVSQIEIQ